MRTRKLLLAGSLVAALAMTGCNGGDPEQEWLTVTDTPSPPTQTSTPPAPTPTETPTVTEPPTATEEPTASSREQDLLDIAETSQAFEDHISAIAVGHEPLGHLDDVAAEQAREIWGTALQGDLEAGWRQIGTVTVEVLHVDWITNDQVTTQVCVDVSEVDVVDEDGNSVVDPERPDRQLRERDLRRAGEQSAYGWLVTSDLGASEPCS